MCLASDGRARAGTAGRNKSNSTSNRRSRRWRSQTENSVGEEEKKKRKKRKKKRDRGVLNHASRWRTRSFALPSKCARERDRERRGIQTSASVRRSCKNGCINYPAPARCVCWFDGQKARWREIFWASRDACVGIELVFSGLVDAEIGRASCRERVSQLV